jgi:CDP-glucose 4,6-dehydratase
MGSVNLLDAVRKCESVRSLVYITSDKCYENVEWIWGYRENDRIGGHDPYSASKGASEIVFSAYARSFFASRPSHGAATTRAGNVIGGGDWAADRIIPDCIKAIENDEPIQIRNPLATRPWQHVLEPLGGYLYLAQKLSENKKFNGESYNFGPLPENDHSVLELVYEMSKNWSQVSYEIDSSSSEIAHAEAGLLKLSCEKAMSDLGWHATLNFCKTVEMTTEWYKSFYENSSDLFEYTVSQINDYTILANNQKLEWAK